MNNHLSSTLATDGRGRKVLVASAVGIVVGALLLAVAGYLLTGSQGFWNGLWLGAVAGFAVGLLLQANLFAASGVEGIAHRAGDAIRQGESSGDALSKSESADALPDTESKRKLQ